MRPTIAAALSLGLLAACSSSTSDPPATATDSAIATDTAPTDTSTTTPDTAVVDSATTSETSTGACAFTGNWSLEKMMCGTTDVTASWKGVIPESTFTFTVGAKGCHVVNTNKSSVCTEKQEYEWVVAADGKITSADSPGITSCEPAMCSFTTGDAPCKIGDRAGTGDLVSATLKNVGGKLVIDVTKETNICKGQPQQLTLVTK